MVAVHVGVRTDDDLAPVEVVQVKGAQVLDTLVPDLYAAAQHAHEVHDDVGLEDAGVVLLQAVEDLASDGITPWNSASREVRMAPPPSRLHDVDLAAGLSLERHR